MLRHPFLERLDAALVGKLPNLNIALHGNWTSQRRQSSQEEIVDHVWDARLTSATAITGMALLQTESKVYWVKSAQVGQELGARVALTARVLAGVEEREKTFTPGFGDAYLPGVPVVASSDDPSECLVGTTVVPAGRVVCIARCDGAAFYVVLFAAESVKFGRNRLWRARDSIATQLPPDVGALLTRRRAGVIRPEVVPSIR